MAEVSVIVPVYNREGLLPETMDSVRAQTLEDWECVVVDDHSTDGSLQVAQRYAADDPRFRAIRREGGPQGANRCRNQGFAASTGEYVVFLDSDDLLAPWCLARRTQAIRDLGHLDAVMYVSELFRDIPGDCDVCWNVPTDEGDLYRFLGRDGPWQTAGPLWSASALRSVGPWAEDLVCWQDWEYHIRALAHGIRYRYVDEVDTFWRSPDQGRNTIGQLSAAARHIEGQFRALAMVVGHVKARPGLWDHCRRRAAMRYWEVAERWVCARRHWRAGVTWSSAYAQRATSLGGCIGGLALLAVLASPAGERGPARRMVCRWRRQFGARSATLMALPASRRRPCLPLDSVGAGLRLPRRGQG